VTNIKRIAFKDTEIPNADTLATLVESIQLVKKRSPNLDPQLSGLIDNLPSPRQIKREFSVEECNVLYETVGYLWKELTGQDYISQQSKRPAPETLQGNYWMMNDGLLLHGVNHFSIIKQNSSLFATLLNINPMVMQEYLSAPPNKLIGLVIRAGGIRIFISKEKKFFAQMTSETYGKWGRDKVRKYDFENKIVRIIDTKVPFKSWKSGIPIKL